MRVSATPAGLFEHDLFGTDEHTVVVNPSISFAQLVKELIEADKG
jgi:hypothetical protein